MGWGLRENLSCLLNQFTPRPSTRPVRDVPIPGVGAEVLNVDLVTLEEFEARGVIWKDFVR